LKQSLFVIFLIIFAADVSFSDVQKICESNMKSFRGKFNDSLITPICSRVKVLNECQSVKGVPIYHYEKISEKLKGAKNIDVKNKGQNILVFSLIHGDELPAGSVGRFWMERLEGIDPRNSWRVVPVLNPDGLALKTRTNANKIDLNRNFPTLDWNEKAKDYWKKDSKSNPRRFPGDAAGSEPEVKCALKHIEEFKPDLVVSVHTPLKVLDYDGPSIKPPKFDYLPWKSLGHYPGSLGRYLWFERKTPVLTMELKEDLPSSAQPILELQDIIGFLVSIEFGQKDKAPVKEVTSPEAKK
jgi:murein peptide amidase A